MKTAWTVWVFMCVICIAFAHAEERTVSLLDDVTIAKVNFENSNLVEVLETLRLMTATTYHPTWFVGNLRFEYSFDPRKSFKKVTFKSPQKSLRKILTELLSPYSIDVQVHDDRLEFVDVMK